MKTINLDSLHCFVEIVDGLFEECNSIVVEYYLNSNTEWQTQQQSNRKVKKDENVILRSANDTNNDANNEVNNEITTKLDREKNLNEITEADIRGCTRKSIRDSNNRYTFNHLFELNFEFNKQRIKQEIKKIDQKKHAKSDRKIEDCDKIENLNKKNEIPKEDQLRLDWPYFELRVWNIDQWKRKTFIGLAFVCLPQKPGKYNERINIWSLKSNQPKTKLMQYFLGYLLEPSKSKLTDKNDWRVALSSQKIGCITIKLNLVICKHVPTHLESEGLDEIEAKIQKVVIAFRDARRRMQFLLKEKESIKFI